MVSCQSRNAALALRAQRYWPSCPGLTRASTPFFFVASKDVDGRDKPRHDELDEEKSMATPKLLLLPRDRIGPAVMAQVKRLIDWLNAQGIAHFETEQGLVGGAAYEASKQSITDPTMAQAMAADAVIFGAVGGPKWDSVPYEARPEAGLLRAADRAEDHGVRGHRLR